MGKLTKRADGRYQRRVTLSDGTKKVVYGKSEPEVNRKVRELEKADSSGVVIGDTTTVAQWSITWLKTYKAEFRYKTKEMYLNVLNNHILPQIGDMQLKNVKSVHIQNIMNTVAKKSESLQTKILNTLRQLYKTAIINHLISFNPCDGIKINKNTVDDKVKFISKEQQVKLIESVQEPRARLFCFLCLYAGLRREEALGLQWGDIDCNKNTITIRRAISFAKNLPEDDTSLKTKAANREIPLKLCFIKKVFLLV